ncbi:MAG: flagellar filament capping protein FliD [Terracidiphilus sp.]
MGTVGLNFGSPTSGAGFDVSSTVASIVSNLQDVETPWKTQLTALQSQDTVISSLGTLFSKLTNDISSLTDPTGIMAQKTGSVSNTGALEITSASSSAVAGTHTVVVTSLATTSSGVLTSIANASDTLSGSITIQVGTSGKAQTISVPSSDATLNGLAGAINSSGVGVTASVLTDSSGSRLSLVSGTSGANGTIIVHAASNSIADTSNSNAPLAYSASSTVPADAQLTVDGEPVTSASNTLTNVIAGITFQLLAPSAKESDGSLEQIQLVIGNDNTDVASTINTMVSDYNSLISAMNAQEGNDSSGNPEPLFGSPTLSLLQQQLLGSLNVQNPNGTMDSIASNTDTTLAGQMSITVGSGATDTFIVGPGTNTANIFYTGTGVNTLEGLSDAINAANSGTTLGFAQGAGPTTGSLDVLDTGTSISGSLSLTVGSGTAENIVIGSEPANGPVANTIYTADYTADGSSDDTLAALAATINGYTGLGVTANLTTDSKGLQTLTLSTGSSDSLTAASSVVAAGPGVSATITTANSQSTLSLLSHTAGPSGVLTVNSTLGTTSDQLLSYAGLAGIDITAKSAATTSSGVLTGIPDPNDNILTNSLTIQVGDGAPATINLGSGTTLPDGTPVNTLSALNTYINDNTASFGVTAEIVQNTADNSFNLMLTSNTIGSAGTLTVTSSVLNTSNTSSGEFNYTNSSDISGLANLGITVSSSDDGTISFDETVLTSALNSDYSGVLSFFQNLNSWGQTFSTILNNAGTSSSSGALSLASKSNSSTESTLNANISREESMISIQQKSLTAELNSANEIMQELPSQLQGIDELYSAITGYNSSTNG